MSVLKRGGVVAVPTDTLYGLAASAFDVKAVRRLYRIKARDPRTPLPLLLADPVDFDRYAVGIPDAAWRLIERFMPGPLTLVLRRAEDVPDIVSGGRDTVALRIPDHPVPRAVVRRLGAPITGTSANRSGSPGLTTAEAVREKLGSKVDLVVDGGRAPAGVPSTVLDISGPAPAILREGAVRRRDIEDAWAGPIGAG